MKKNIFIYILTGIFTQGLIFLLWILLPYFHEPAVLGEYNLLLFYLELISTLAILGGDSVILRYYYSEYKKNEIFGSVFWTLILSYLILGICFSIIYKLSSALLHISNLNVFILLLVTILFNSLTNLILVHFISEKKPTVYRNLQIWKTIIFFLLAIGFSYFSFGIYSFLYANIVSLGLIVFYHFKSSSLSEFKFPSKLIFSKTIKYGAPLSLYSVMGVLTIYSSRLFIDSYLNLGLLGIFGFYNIITNQINGLWSSFNKAWTPEVFTKIQKSNSTDFIYDTIYLVVFIYFSLVLIGVLLGNAFLFDIFFQKEYIKYINVFIILLFYPLVTSIYTILYPLFYFNDNTIRIMRISIYVAIFTIIITWILTKKNGLLGAAFSILISSIFNLFLYLYYFRKQIKLPVKVVKNLFFIFGAVSLAIFLLIYMNSVFLFSLIVLIITVFVFVSGNLLDFFTNGFKRVEDRS